MPKVWNIGNTTVRNAKRLENALRVLVEEGFSGNISTKDQQAQLIEKYDEKQVVIYGDIDQETKEINGRKWRAAFYQLGFISYEEYDIGGKKLNTKELFTSIGISDVELPYQITPAGKKLISATAVPESEDIFTRQYACYELPSSIENGFPTGAKMKPFILFLQVLTLLQKVRMAGLNKYETGLFLQKFRDHTPTLAQEIFEEVRIYREELTKSKSVKEIRLLNKKYKDNLGAFAGIDPNSILRDYSDTTFRYFSLSGLFTRIGDTIIIRPNKQRFVDRLLQIEPQFLADTNQLQYFDAFYKNSYPIPTDNVEVALEEIEFLKTGVKDKKHPLLTAVDVLNVHSSIEEVQRVRYTLIEYNNWEREEDYANEQQSEDAVKDILNYLKCLNNESVPDEPEIDDKPAYLEWAVWRSFLAVDEIKSRIHETRRFPVDQDFKPRNTAPGGGSDLIFEFDSYVLVVEVTLTLSNRQMAVESEPVRRHTVQYKELFPDKEVYCLFIAPSVDNNVAETFRIGVWYKQDNEEFVNIIPMSLTDFINAIDTLLHKKFRNRDFLNLLDKCLTSRNVRAPQWKQSITQEVVKWKRKMIT